MVKYKNSFYVVNQSIYKLMDKYGKLRGTIEKPLFSDRQFVIELEELAKKNRDEVAKG